MKSSDPIAVFNICQDNIGMFAQLSYCLLLMKYCNENKLKPYFFLTGKGNIDSSQGDNWFDYYFIHRQLSNDEHSLALRKYENGEYFKIRNRYDVNELTRGDKNNEIQNELTTIHDGKKLFECHIAIKDHVINTVNGFCVENFKNKEILGLHFRGLDKFHETTLLEYNFVLSTINKYKNKFDSIFLASDEPGFMQYIEEKITDINIITYCYPSGEIHFQDNSSNYQKGLDALIDCLLLSRCNLLIKTPSLLSAWSKIFNPRLPAVLLGRPDLYPNNERGIKGYGYYPESALYQAGFINKFRNRVKEMIFPPNVT